MTIFCGKAASPAPAAGVLIDEDFENASTPRGSVLISDIPDPRREMLLSALLEQVSES